jgi:hypothetical protein
MSWSVLSLGKMAHDRLPLRLPFAAHAALCPFAAARARRLQRIFARLLLRLGRNRGRRGFSRWMRQIIRAATATGRGHDGPDPKQMQIACLTPAMRLAADGVAHFSFLLNIIDRLDRHSDPHPDFNSFSVLMARRRPRSSRRGKTAGTKPACVGDAVGQSAAACPDCPLPT